MTSNDIVNFFHGLFFPIEKITKCFGIIDSNHAQVHAANAFQVCLSKSLTAGATMNLAIEVPADAYVHLQVLKVLHGGAVKIEFLENLTSFANGAAETPANKHRITNTASVLTVTTDVDTIVGGTDLIAPLFLGATGAPQKSSVGGGFDNGDSEWILKQSCTYLLRVTSLEGSEAQNVALLPFWYEETAA